MAVPHQFFDPFFSPPLRNDSTLTVTITHEVSHKAHTNTIAQLSSSAFADVISTPLHKKAVTNAIPKLPVIPQETIIELPVTGQGTISVSCKAKKKLRFEVKTERKEGQILYLDIDTKGAKFSYKSSPTADKYLDIPAVQSQPKNPKACALQAHETKYWLSIHHNHGMLRYGRGHANAFMTLLEARLKTEKKEKDKKKEWVWPENSDFEWLEDLKTVRVTYQHEGLDAQNMADKNIRISRVPVVIDRSPFIKAPERITLLDLETGAYTAPANLPEACQELYSNIYGVELQDEHLDFPFAATIQYSCITPGCWAYQTLQDKAHGGHLDSNIKGTYLRITLGYNLGDSPGVPYVMEIWPAGHYSPIHDHGDACAVIKVLHGEIRAKYYTDLKHTIKLGNTAVFRKGDITWLGEYDYQIHKLKNKSDYVCVTLQCYRYSKTQDVHLDIFRFKKDGDNEPHDFTPNSDSTFGEFREQMSKEYKVHRQAIDELAKDRKLVEERRSLEERLRKLREDETKRKSGTTS